MNILGKRYIFFGISLLIILAGLGIIIFRGIPLSIDFTGGSLLEVQFEGQSPETTQIYAVYDEAGIEDVQVQTSDSGTYIIRSQFLENDDRDAVIAALNATIGEVTVERFDSVGPSIGETGHFARCAGSGCFLAAGGVVHRLVVPRRHARLPLWHLRHPCHDP
jgi:preprotein translocase subunit SecF